jgi:hypothetical protein
VQSDLQSSVNFRNLPCAGHGVGEEGGVPHELQLEGLRGQLPGRRVRFPPLILLFCLSWHQPKDSSVHGKAQAELRVVQL